MRSITFTILLALSVYFVSDNVAFGAVNKSAQQFTFEYSFEGSTYTYRTPASDWTDAFERGAQACFRFFKQGQKISEDRGIGLVDSCANPKEKKGT